MADDRFPPYKTAEIGTRDYHLILDSISLTERQTHGYVITQENEPPNFTNQVFGIYVKNRNVPAQDVERISGKIDRTVISIRVLDATIGALYYEYRGPIFDFEKFKNRDDNYGLRGTSQRINSTSGIDYGRYIDDLQYHLDRYYTILGIETPFRKTVRQRIEFSVFEPMVEDASFDGVVMIVIRGGIGK